MWLDLNIRNYFYRFCRETGLEHSFFRCKHATYNNSTRFIKQLLSCFNNMFDYINNWNKKYCGKSIQLSSNDKKQVINSITKVTRFVEDLDYWLRTVSKIHRFPMIDELNTVLVLLYQYIERDDRCIQHKSFINKINACLLKLFGDHVIKMIKHSLTEKGFMLHNTGIYKIRFYINPLIDLRKYNKKHVLSLTAKVYGVIKNYISDNANLNPKMLEKISKDLFETYPNSSLLGIEDGRHRHLIFIIRVSEIYDSDFDIRYYSVGVYIYHYVDAGEHDECFRITPRGAKAVSNNKYCHITSCHNWKITNRSIIHTKDDGIRADVSLLSNYSPLY